MSSGRGIVAEMRHQASSLFKAEMVDDVVASVDFEAAPFRIRLNHSTDEITSHTIVVASGADSRWLQVS